MTRGTKRGREGEYSATDSSHGELIATERDAETPLDADRSDDADRDDGAESSPGAHAGPQTQQGPGAIGVACWQQESQQSLRADVAPAPPPAGFNAVFSGHQLIRTSASPAPAQNSPRPETRGNGSGTATSSRLQSENGGSPTSSTTESSAVPAAESLLVDASLLPSAGSFIASQQLELVQQLVVQRDMHTHLQAAFASQMEMAVAVSSDGFERSFLSRSQLSRLVKYVQLQKLMLMQSASLLSVCSDDLEGCLSFALGRVPPACEPPASAAAAGTEAPQPSTDLPKKPETIRHHPLKSATVSAGDTSISDVDTASICRGMKILGAWVAASKASGSSRARQ